MCTRAEDLCPCMCSFIKLIPFLPPGVKVPILCCQLELCQHFCDITEWNWMLLFHTLAVITEHFGTFQNKNILGRVEL